jgi:hypothetical protein
VRTPDRFSELIVQAESDADVVLRPALPKSLPRALAMHCAEEFASLAALLPELDSEFGRDAAPKVSRAG